MQHQRTAAMDLSGPKYLQSPPLVFGSSNVEPRSKEYSSLGDSLEDPLCKLNLKETSEFVRSFPMRREGVSLMGNRRGVVESPSTPGRPVFSFSSSSIVKKAVPSKWDDAEKWLISSSSCHESPAHNNFLMKSSSYNENGKVHSNKKGENFNKKGENFSQQVEEKSRVTQEKVSKLVSGLQGGLTLDQCGPGVASFSNGACVPGDMYLKDKFTDDVEPVLPKFRYTEPLKEGFFFKNSASETMKDAGTGVLVPVKHRDMGTEMTPLGSSTTSRCNTPFTFSSPARHNTPANRSGPLALENSSSTISPIDISQLQECHLAKLQLGTQYDSLASNWSSRQEEEEDVSKSLRHFETGVASRKSVSDSRAAAWEEDEKTKCCLRYQREEAKIQAWLNLQNAKAEAQSKKLEVKIQKMRSSLEEKLMKRMAAAHKKAEEWREAALREHTEQVQRAKQQSKKMVKLQTSSSSSSCSCCFPCNN